MKKLIVFRKELDFSEEQEIFAETEFGMDCIVIRESGEVTVLNNCTEFHHRYTGMFEESSAFESDIHGQGMTIPVAVIDTIIVSEATEKHNDY